MSMYTVRSEDNATIQVRMHEQTSRCEYAQLWTRLRARVSSHMLFRHLKAPDLTAEIASSARGADRFADKHHLGLALCPLLRLALDARV